MQLKTTPFQQFSVIFFFFFHKLRKEVTLKESSREYVSSMYVKGHLEKNVGPKCMTDLNF